VSDKPTWLRESAEDRSQTVEEQLDTDHQKRMGSLLAVDDMVVDIVDALERTGQRENTYLMFLSDNGYNMGAHRLWQKQAPYEESLRVPLVVSGPGVHAGQEDRMAVMTDVAPTILELAGQPVPEDVDGRSLAPLLRGEEPADWRTDFFGQYVSDGTTTSDGVMQEMPDDTENTEENPIDIPAWRGVRTEQYTYVEWQDGTGDRELYDLHQDPYQLTNLISTAEGQEQYADVVDGLAARTEELSTCSGASCR
ncbi:MAG: sulfatase/phosphatase domain-containing protein, partial [Phycicoccus sp.]